MDNRLIALFQRKGFYSIPHDGKDNDKQKNARSEVPIVAEKTLDSKLRKLDAKLKEKLKKLLEDDEEEEHTSEFYPYEFFTGGSM